MKITKKSIYSGRTNTLEIPISKDQYDRYIEGKEMIQNIMPELSAELREFLINGTTPAEQEELEKQWKDLSEQIEREDKILRDLKDEI